MIFLKYGQKFRKPLHKKLKKYKLYYYIYYSIRDRVDGVRSDESTNLTDSKFNANLPHAFAEFYEKENLASEIIVYESFHGSKFTCSPRAIFRAALDDPRFADFTHVIILDDPQNLSSDYAELENVICVKRSDIKYAKYLATAKVLVNNSTFPSWFCRREDQIYVNTWHGTPLKTMFMDEGGSKAGYANSQRNFLQASHIILSSEYDVDHLLGSADIRPLVENKTYLTGKPRLDTTIEMRDKSSFSEDLGTKKILFAPTWRGTLGKPESQLKIFEDVISELLGTSGKDIEIYISVHNFNKDNIDKLSVSNAAKLFLIEPTEDSNEVLSKMDVLITDYSSIMFDALSVDIPTILLVPDLEAYREQRGLYFELNELPVSICEDVTELCAVVKKVKQPSSFKKNIYDGAREKFFKLEDGNATKRVLDLIDNDGDGVEPISTTSKPILAIMAGGWLRNGITTSMCNLLSNLDQKIYDIVVLTDGKSMRDEAWEQLKRVPEGVMIIHRVGAEGFALEETKIKRKFYSTNSLSKPEEDALMEQAMRREARRIFGSIKAHAALDFSGYRRLWTWIMAMVNSDCKIIYQHNDLFSESQIKHPDLKGVFYTYKFYDYVASVSQETQYVNESNLYKFYGNAEAVSIRNTLDIDSILSAAQSNENNINVDMKDYMALTVDTNPQEGVLSINAIPELDTSYTNFVSIGRFSAEKNHKFLLKSFKILLGENNKCRLYILGEGPLLEETRKFRDKLGLGDKVVIPGFTNQALRILQKSDCFVLPSIYEGQPMVILEALTLDKPVIVTNIPGSRSSLSGGYGYVVSENTIECFSQAMIDFCDNKIKFKKFNAKKYNQSALQDLMKLF